MQNKLCVGYDYYIIIWPYSTVGIIVLNWGFEGGGGVFILRWRGSLGVLYNEGLDGRRSNLSSKAGTLIPSQWSLGLEAKHHLNIIKSTILCRG